MTHSIENLTLAPGNAIQVGLMALTGHFDAETICGVHVPYHYSPPDWRVDELTDLGPTEFYRYRIIGENMNCREGEYGHRFCWRVPALCWRYFWLAEAPSSNEFSTVNLPNGMTSHLFNDCQSCGESFGLKIHENCA